MKKFLIFIFSFFSLFLLYITGSVNINATSIYTITNVRAIDINGNNLKDGNGIFFYDSSKSYAYYLYQTIEVNQYTTTNYLDFESNKVGLTTYSIYGNIETHFNEFEGKLFKVKLTDLGSYLYNPNDNIYPNSFAQVSIVNGIWCTTMYPRAKYLDNGLERYMYDGVGFFEFNDSSSYKFNYINLLDGQTSDFVIIPTYLIPDWISNPLSYDFISIKYGRWTECDIITKVGTYNADFYVSYHLLKSSHKWCTVNPCFYINFDFNIDQLLTITLDYKYSKKNWLGFWKEPSHIISKMNCYEETYEASTKLHWFTGMGKRTLVNSIQKGEYEFDENIYNYKVIDYNFEIDVAVIGTSSLNYVWNNQHCIKDDISIVSIDYYYNEVLYHFDENVVQVNVIGNTSNEGGITFNDWLTNLKTFFIKSKSTFEKIIYIVIIGISLFLCIKIIPSVLNLKTSIKKYKKNK